MPNSLSLGALYSKATKLAIEETKELHILRYVLATSDKEILRAYSFLLGCLSGIDELSLIMLNRSRDISPPMMARPPW
jgi:hypothetical protein